MFLISDLIKYMDIPVIIVARAGLGTINHTVLTIEYAKNPGIINELSGIPILGIIPTDTSICSEKGISGNIVSLIGVNVDLDRIINYQVFQ